MAADGHVSRSSVYAPLELRTVPCAGLAFDQCFDKHAVVDLDSHRNFFGLASRKVLKGLNELCNAGTNMLNRLPLSHVLLGIWDTVVVALYRSVNAGEVLLHPLTSSSCHTNSPFSLRS